MDKSQLRLQFGLFLAGRLSSMNGLKKKEPRIAAQHVLCVVVWQMCAFSAKSPGATD